jgi:hypothetical protein
MAGQGRPLAVSDRYPDATRLAETRKSFETSAEPGRFGTEGSEVQILSPRPLIHVIRPLFFRKNRPFVFMDVARDGRNWDEIADGGTHWLSSRVRDKNADAGVAMFTR